ncbi:hypothetical protein ACFU44_07260 [Nocardia rhizosphaerihabitans]
MDSTKADAAPKVAIAHIQNTAPGPPTLIAVATRRYCRCRPAPPPS